MPFPHPRDLITLSASPEFGRLKLDIWRVLEDEVNARAGGGGTMTGLSGKARERLLYLISPIGLLLLWQLLLMARHRRPPLHSGAERHRGRFWHARGQRRAGWHTAVTLYRVLHRLRDRRQSRRSRSAC